MRLLIRWLRRFAVLGLGIVGVWFIIFVLRITDRRLPTILALSLTYAIAAYVILPRVASSPMANFVMLVGKGPGANAFTVTCFSASSAARMRVR